MVRAISSTAFSIREMVKGIPEAAFCISEIEKGTPPDQVVEMQALMRGQNSTILGVTRSRRWSGISGSVSVQGISGGLNAAVCHGKI